MSELTLRRALGSWAYDGATVNLAASSSAHQPHQPFLRFILELYLGTEYFKTHRDEASIYRLDQLVACEPVFDALLTEADIKNHFRND